MESSSKPSLSCASLFATQTNPVSKPSHPTPFPLSSSVPVRAPLTPDDDDDDDGEENDNDNDTESNDTELDLESSSVTSVSGNEFESSGGGVRRFALCLDEKASEEESEEESDYGSSLKPVVVRPIAQISWDSDDDYYDDDDSDLFIGGSEVEFEVDSFGGAVGFSPLGVAVAGKISVAPRVEVFGAEEVIEGKSFVGSENEEEEEEVHGGFGSLNGCEESNLACSKVDLGVDMAEIESHGFGSFKGCEESNLAVSEDGANEKCWEVCLGVEMAEIESCGGYEGLNLAPSEEVATEKSRNMDVGDGQFCTESHGVGLKGCEEVDNLAAPGEEAEAETSSQVGLEIGKLCVEKVETEALEVLESSEKCSEVDLGFEQVEFGKLEIVEHDVFVDTNVARSVSIESSDGSELLGLETDVVIGGNLENEANLAVAEKPSFAVSNAVEKKKKNRKISDEDSMVDNTLEFNGFEGNQEESNSSGISVSNRADEIDVEESTAEIANETEDSEDDSQRFGGLGEEGEKEMKKIWLLRVSFLRLVNGLGISFEDSKVTQVLNKLVLPFGQLPNHFGFIESAKKKAMSLEAKNKTDLDFSLNILVLGKSGVGKSATVNLIFGEKKVAIDAFEPATTSLKEIVGTINGVKITVLDTPGLKVNSNRKVLGTVRRRLKKFSPDIVLYVDRLDTDTRDTDFPIMKSITTSLGPSIWKNAVIALTHSSSAPPDGPLGVPISNKIVAARKSHAILQSIGKSLGKVNLANLSLGCQVSMVENHPTASRDSNGRSELLLLCYSMKVLSLANLAPEVKKPSYWSEIPGFAAGSACAVTEDDAKLKVLLDFSMFQEINTVGEKNKLSCVLRNEARFRNFEINEMLFLGPTTPGKGPNPFSGLVFSKLGDGFGVSNSASLQARFSIRRSTKMAVRIVLVNWESVWIRVTATGSGLLPVGLALVLQMLISGSVDK